MLAVNQINAKTQIIEPKTHSTLETVFALVQPQPFDPIRFNTELIAATNTDLRAVPAQIQHICNKAFYQGFFFQGDSENTANETQSTAAQLDQTITAFISTIQQSQHHNLLEPLILKQVMQSQYAQISLKVGGQNGARFSKGIFNTFTLLRLNTGKFVHLTNSLHFETCSQIEKQFQLNLSRFKAAINRQTQVKIVLGRGGQGKVRLGLFAHHKQQTLQPIAIKKITQQQDAHQEILNANTLRSNYIPQFYGFTAAKKNHVVEKYYLAYQLIDGGTGLAYAHKIQGMKQNQPNTFEQAVIHAAKQYTLAVLSIHAQGYAHSDIKLENFLHSTNGEVYITDLGFAHQQLDNFNGGTCSFCPPETDSWRYNAQLHDSFSLGICLLALMYGGVHQLQDSVLLTSSPQRFGLGQKFTLTKSKTLNPYGQKIFQGLENTSHIKINRLIDVIIKLLDKNPAKRLTVLAAGDFFTKNNVTLNKPQLEHESTQALSTFEALEACQARTTTPNNSELSFLLQGIN